MVTLPLGRPPVRAEVAVHVPEALDTTRPVHAVVVFHAAGVCAAEMVWPGEFDRQLCHRSPGRGVGWGFAARHDVAHTNTVLIVPQLHTGRDGIVTRPGGLRTVLDAVAGEVGSRIRPPASSVRFASLVFMAHSLGGRTLLRVLAQPDVRGEVSAVLLYDVLGDDHETVLRWWRERSPPSARRLAMIYAGVREATALARSVSERLRREAPGSVVSRVEDFTEALRGNPVVSMRSGLPHGYVPYPYFTKSLVALGLPMRDVVEPWERPAPRNPMPIAAGETVEGRLLPPDSVEGDARRYRDYALRLSAGRCVEVELQGGDGPWQPRGLDMRLQVFVGGRRVLDDDDGAARGGPGSEVFDSRARWCASTEETYVLRASARVGDWHGGAFSLTVRASEAGRGDARVDDAVR